jgi:hypothetical protein
MALTGAAAPAFADNGTAAAAAAAAPAPVTVTCTFTPAIINPGTGQVVSTVTLRVSPQAAAFLTANARTFINPLTGIQTTVSCSAQTA